MIAALKRREFITLLACAATWPLAARAAAGHLAAIALAAAIGF